MTPKDPHDRIRREQLEIAAAEGLFEGDTGEKVNPDQASSWGSASGVGETFALADGSSFVDLTAPIPTSSGPGVSGGGSDQLPRSGNIGQTAGQRRLEPSDLVEEVWSRPAEWGPTLLVVGAWVAVVVLLAYFGLALGLFGTAFLTLLFGGIAAVVLSYPILITLERPVRITPEQAVGDYYGALSHHLPHFRRMWLLLSKAGKTSASYGSFEGFKAYWTDRLASMREGHAGPLTPLVFEVIDFSADKSAGKVQIDAKYAVKVWVRGQRKAGPIEVFPMAIALVRGPDKMWYLEDGTLGRPARTT